MRCLREQAVSRRSNLLQSWVFEAYRCWTARGCRRCLSTVRIRWCLSSAQRVPWRRERERDGYRSHRTHRIDLPTAQEEGEPGLAYLTEHSIRRHAEGGYILRCDPAIGEAYRPWRVGNVTMWDQWERVRCPTLLLRGEESDMLLASTAEEMTRRGPKADLLEFPGVGHVPTLMTLDQITPVIEFLTRGKA